MRVFKWLNLIALLFFFSCGKSVPELDGFDQNGWKNDRNGCKGVRSEMKDFLRKEKNQLLALDEVEIVSLLGRPDRNELFKRNQKFFQYFIEPGPDCNPEIKQVVSPTRLTIRFNAMGLAKEIAVE